LHGSREAGLFIKHPDFASVAEDEESITMFDEHGSVEVIDVALVVLLHYREREETI
jgi:hypothetical protein